MDEKITVVFGVGFTSEYVIRIMTDRGVRDVSSVVLFTVTPEEEYKKRQAEEELNVIMKYLKTVGIDDYSIKSLSIDVPFDYLVYQIADSLWTRNVLEFYIIGDMKVPNLALYYYAILAKSLGKRVRAYSFDMNYKYELILSVPQKPSEAEFEILDYLANTEGETYLTDLVRILGKSLPTISKQLGILESQGYVRCKETKPKPCEITDLGRAVAKSLRGLKR